MNVSPNQGRTDLVTATVLVGGRPIPDIYTIARITVTREVSRIGHACITLTDGDSTTGTFVASESSLFVPGQQVEIHLGYHSQNKSVFTGIIVQQGLHVSSASVSQLQVTCSDLAVRMTMARKNTIYTDVQDQAVLEKMITSYSLKPDVEAGTVTYAEQVSFAASDWDFLCGRADAMGKIVVVDNDQVSVRSPAVAASCGLVVAYGESLWTLDAQLDARHQYAGVTATAWDISEQKIISATAAAPAVNVQGNIDGATLARALDTGKTDFSSAAPLARDDLQQWADARLLRSRLARIRGNVSFQGNALPSPGKTIELAGLSPRFNGDAFISRVSHTLESGHWLTDVTFGLSPHWFVEDNPDVDGPPAAGLIPGIAGLQVGTVMQIDQDPLTLNRVLIDLPLIQSSGKGIWARLGTPYATASSGMMFMPETGDEVIMGFMNDDPRFPVILGSLFSSRHVAPYTPDKPNTSKAIVTKGQLKITFQDVEKTITIETPGGQSVVLSDKDNSVTVTDVTKNRIRMSAEGLALSSPGNISLTADGTVKISGKQGITLESTASINAHATAALSLKGDGSAEFKLVGQAVVKGALVMIN